MTLLISFLLRLAFGLAVAMTVAPWRKVPAGYYRVHAYVLLGLCVLAALAATGVPHVSGWPSASGAVASYAAAVIWLYERPRAGTAALLLVAALALWGAWGVLPASSDATPAARALARLDPASGGLLLGSTMAAMLLGHWYLNSPGMQLGPLRRLLLLMAGAILLRAAVSGAGLALVLSTGAALADADWLFLALRWSAGIAGALAVCVLAWKTLDVPNTQSATGILYVGVIVTFLGELTAMLLSAGADYPL